ncbi:hypothetical protein B0H10DRAFT_2003535 [Mycena sp. CBHHK59/15]|nr:hypothetical protein B0H10DRAFT_2003535 [Mycena sp. CBHHK59/15]
MENRQSPKWPRQVSAMKWPRANSEYGATSTAAITLASTSQLGTPTSAPDACTSTAASLSSLGAASAPNTTSTPTSASVLRTLNGNYPVQITSLPDSVSTSIPSYPAESSSPSSSSSADTSTSFITLSAILHTPPANPTAAGASGIAIPTNANPSTSSASFSVTGYPTLPSSMSSLTWGSSGSSTSDNVPGSHSTSPGSPKSKSGGSTTTPPTSGASSTVATPSASGTSIASGASGAGGESGAGGTSGAGGASGTAPNKSPTSLFDPPGSTITFTAGLPNGSTATFGTNVSTAAAFQSALTSHHKSFAQNAGDIAGVAVSAIAALVLGIFLTFLACRRRNRSRRGGAPYPKISSPLLQDDGDMADAYSPVARRRSRGGSLRGNPAFLRPLSFQSASGENAAVTAEAAPEEMDTNTHYDADTWGAAPAPPSPTVWSAPSHHGSRPPSPDLSPAAPIRRGRMPSMTAKGRLATLPPLPESPTSPAPLPPTSFTSSQVAFVSNHPSLPWIHRTRSSLTDVPGWTPPATWAAPPTQSSEVAPPTSEQSLNYSRPMVPLNVKRVRINDPQTQS